MPTYEDQQFYVTTGDQFCGKWKFCSTLNYMRIVYAIDTDVFVVLLCNFYYIKAVNSEFFSKQERQST